MNPYHAFLDAQERSNMTEDGKLEKRNSEILMSYRTLDDNFYKPAAPDNMTTKSESVHMKPENNKKKYK